MEATATRPLPDDLPHAALKARVRDALVRVWPEVVALSRTLHARPELGYAEFAAARHAAALLGRHGFEVDLGIARMPTAFRAVRRAGDGPTVALLAELDAVQLVDAKRPSWETIGHGCGHNVMTAAAVGAALALAETGSDVGGRVAVFGTPAEETGFRSGGKELLRRHGWFNGVAAAMQIHPADRDYVARPLWPAWSAFELRFRATTERPLPWSSAEPHPFERVVDAMRAVVPGAERLDVQAPPAGDDWSVADRTELRVTMQLRADGIRGLERLEDDTLRAATALAAPLGLEVASALVRNRYDGMVDNPVLADAFMRNAAAMGRPFEPSAHPDIASLGDMGNVSRAVPSIHPFVGLGARVPGHSSQFAELVAGDAGEAALWTGALGMAWTCLEVLVDAGVRASAWEAYLVDPRIDS